MLCASLILDARSRCFFGAFLKSSCAICNAPRRYRLTFHILYVRNIPRLSAILLGNELTVTADYSHHLSGIIFLSGTMAHAPSPSRSFVALARGFKRLQVSDPLAVCEAHLRKFK